jgi:hypothetical protein
MSYRSTYEEVVVTAANMADLSSRIEHPIRIGDTVHIYHLATEVDLRLFAQLAESLGAPFPDEQ